LLNAKGLTAECELRDIGTYLAMVIAKR